MKKILLCLLLLILGIVIGSGLTFIFINNNSTTKDLESEESESQNRDGDLATNISLTNFYPDSIAIIAAGNVYVNVYGTTADIDNLYGEGSYQTLLATRSNYQKYDFEGLDYKDKLNSHFLAMKLNIQNAKAVYSYAYGQSLTSNYGLIILSDDGTLSIISFYSLIMGKQDVTQISSLENIVEVESVNNNGYMTYAYDKNNTLYNLSDYIPTDYTLW